MAESTKTLTLTDFILARLAEDEAVAREAARQGRDEPDTSEWYPSEVPGPSMRRTPDEPTRTVIDSPGCLVTHAVVREAFAQHIASHDPARVLRDVEAKRRIVGALSEVVGDGGVGDSLDTFAAQDAARFSLRALALSWSDHDDYRDEWRV